MPSSLPLDKKGNLPGSSVEHTEYAVGAHDKVDNVPVAVHQGAAANILSHLTKEELLSDVSNFAQRFGLTDHLPLLEKGALLAQRPTEYDYIDELTPDDKEAIAYEHAHKWSHPLTLYLTIICCSIGAATQGWDQTGSNGANLSFPDEFGISTAETNPDHNKNEWLVGLVNAAPYIASSLVGSWLSDPINNLVGRRGCIFITAIILVATPIGSAFTHSWQTLFVVRLILGLGMGAKGATVPVFAAENSPASIRGALVMGWQLWTAFGIFLGFCANVIVADVGKNAWRLQLGSAFIPAFPLAIGIFFCPESPRWLLKKGRAADAFKSLRRLRHHDLQAARDLYLINFIKEEEDKIIKANSFVKRFIELWSIPRVRRATVASGVIMLAQQMCGINIIAFYSSSVFVQSGSSSRVALYASLGFGAVNFVFAFPALITIDTFGRRSLVLATFPTMALFLLAAGLSFLIPESAGNARLGCIALFIFLFAAVYSVGEGPVPFTYSAEVFPLANREMGMAWAVSTCLFWAAVLSITFPRMVSAMTITGAFCFYAGLNMIAFVLIFFLLPETKQRTLEELDDVFSVRTGDFASYQVKEVLPHFIQTKLLRKKGVPLRDLYATSNQYEVEPRRRHVAKAHDDSV